MENQKKGKDMPMGKDFAETVELWKKAGAEGNGRCWTNLGLLYLNRPIPGMGKIGELPYDAKKAFECFCEGYAAGDMKAGRHVGLCCSEGIGTDKDAEKAFEWYEKAAERGDSSAKLLIADCLLNGNGTKQNTADAIARYKAMADVKCHDTSNAAYRLGCIYREGKYTDKNPELSRIYFNRTIEYASEHEQEIAAKSKEYLAEL